MARGGEYGSGVGRGVMVMSLLAAGLMGGCMDTRAWTKQDAWYDPSPAMEPSPPALPKEKIYPVVEGQLGAAEAMLAATSAVAVTAAQGSAFSGQTLTSPHLFLVRGVSLNEGTGAFNVILLPGDDIKVYHGSLGHHPVAMNRHPLVVELDRPPRHVYVECGMAE